MSWQCVSLAEATAAPWRNGGGVTRELLAWPAAEWKVRISVADIDCDGAFSAFAGIERWFAVLEGHGVELQVDGTRHRLDAASEPLRFDGGAPVIASLTAGRTRDFNLMAPPGAARLQRVQRAAAFACAGGRLLGLYAHRGEACVRDDAGSLQLVGPALAWRVLAAPASVTLECVDALWMEVAL